MVGLAEWTGEKEILFPEMTALIVGLLIIDKRVWNVSRWQIILLMSLGAVAGICIVRYSPLYYVINLCLAFAFAGACLLMSRATLIPLISACVLPVLLHTESVIYPIAVFSMSTIVVAVQIIMERCGIRSRIPENSSVKPGKRELFRWFSLLCFVGLISMFAVSTDYPYMILPPLMVTFAEMVNSKAGFKNRPTQVFLFLTTAATLGTVFQLVGYHYLHLPETLIMHCSILILHLRMDRKILCSRRGTGFHPHVAAGRRIGMVTFTSIHRCSAIHYYRNGRLPEMLPMESGANYFLCHPYSFT